MVGRGADRVGAGLAQLGEEPDEVDELGAGHEVDQPLGHQRAALLAVLDLGGRDRPELAGGLLEDDPLVVLVGDDPLEDLAVGRSATTRVWNSSLIAWSGSMIELIDVVDRRAEPERAQVGPDPARRRR